MGGHLALLPVKRMAVRLPSGVAPYLLEEEPRLLK